MNDFVMDRKGFRAARLSYSPRELLLIPEPQLLQGQGLQEAHPAQGHAVYVPKAEYGRL